MISKIGYNIRKPKFGRKIRSEVHLLMPLHINRSITKYFPIKTHFKIMHSSVKNLRKVEHDEQNWLRHQKTPVRPKNLK